MDKIDAVVFAQHAPLYIGIPYSRLDCQAYVEQILKDLDVKNPATGKAYNWRGSNDMWRNAVHQRQQIKTDQLPPVGAWLFTIKRDGGEIQRGYHDDMGNAAHVGVHIGNGLVVHSTTGGVQYDKVTSKRWTHYALANVIDYGPMTITPTGCICGCECCKGGD